MSKKKKVHAPDISNHPWIGHVLSLRGGSYTSVDVITTDELARLSARVAQAAGKLTAAQQRVLTRGATEVDTLGIDNLRKCVSVLERHIGIVSDCVEQWDAYAIEASNNGQSKTKDPGQER